MDYFEWLSSQEMLNRKSEVPMMEQSQMSNKHLPVVFKWEGGGKNVFISGSFNHWSKKIPLNKR